MPLELPVLVTDAFGRSFQIHDAPLPARPFRGPRIGFPHAQAARSFIEQGDLEPGDWSLILLHLFGEPDWSSEELIERAAEVLIEGRLWIYPLSPGRNTRLPRVLHNARGEAFQIQGGDPREAPAQGPAERFADLDAARDFVESIEAEAQTWHQVLGLAPEADLSDLPAWLAQSFYEGQLEAHRYHPHARPAPAHATDTVDETETRPDDKAIAACDEPASNGQGRPCLSYEKETRIVQVSMATGEVLLHGIDYCLPGPLPFSCTRYYRSGSSDRDRGLGYGWSTTFTECLHIEGEALWLEDAQGRHIRFPKPAPGASSRNTVEDLVLYREETGYRIHRRDGLTHIFASRPGAQAWPLTELRDRHANHIDFHYEGERLTRITSSWGRTLSLTHDAQGRIHTLIAHDAEDLPLLPPLVRFEYDRGDLVRITDRAGNSEHLAYENHTLVTHGLKGGEQLHFEWDRHDKDALCLKSHGDEGDYEIRYGWDRDELRSSHTDALGHSTHYHYDEHGRMLELIDPNGNTMAWSYDHAAHLLTFTDPLGHTDRFDYDNQGRMIAHKNALNQIRRWHYADTSRPTSFHDAAGQTWHYIYDAQETLISVRDPLGDERRCEYDARGLPLNLTDAEGHTRRFSWNARGECIALNDALRQHCEYGYDALGRLSHVQHADGQRTEYRYDALGRLIRITDGGREVALEYDARGRVLQHTDTLGRITQWRYAHRVENLLSERIDALGQRLAHQYDPAGRLITQNNENDERREFEYDDCDRLVRRVDFDGREQHYYYDAAGHLVTHIDADQRFIEYIYDALGRLTRRYSADGVFSDYDYDALGRLDLARNPACEIRRIHDPLGRLIEERTVDTGTQTHARQVLRHRYERRGLRSHSIFNEHIELAYKYDAAGRMCRILLGGQTVLSIERDQQGRELRREQGALHTLSDHDSEGRLRRQRVIDTNDNILIQRDYRYDAAGRLTQISEPHTGLFEFEYDALDRLLVVSGPDEEERYRYDPTGKRLDEHGAGAGSRPTAFASSRYEYDPNGNRLRELVEEGIGETLFEYDTGNQLIAVQSSIGRIEYVYDALGRRLIKRNADGETRFHWDGTILCGESGPRYERLYIHAPGSPHPLAFVQDDRLYHYHLDRRAWPREITDAAGRIVWQAQYRADGELCKLLIEELHNPLRGQGRYQDAETGLYYRHARYLDPRTGRCIHPDPLALLGLPPKP